MAMHKPFTADTIIDTPEEDFQETEVGRIPKDWEVQSINLLSEKVGSGITPRGGARVYKYEGRIFVRSQNVGWGILLLEDVAFIDEETHRLFDSTRPN